MPDDSDNDDFSGASKIADANIDQNSVGLRIQGYCNSVLEQPNCDFHTAVNKTLKTSEAEINAGLGKAKDHAQFYLRTIQPAIINNVTNISNYYDLHAAVPASLPPGATNADWIDVLRAMKEQADEYKEHAASVARMIGGFHDDLTTDVQSFSTSVGTLNAAVEGDKGVLAQLDQNLADVQGKIDGAIAGIVLSGLAIAGGAFMAAIGAFASFVTGGAATALVVGGLTIVAAGIGGEVASALVLASLQREAAKWLTEKADLKQEVLLVQGMSTGFVTLRDSAAQAVQAATAMESAWQYLSNDLGSLSTDLEKGSTKAGAVRTLFLNAAGTVVKKVITDTDIIKAQMTGVTDFKAPKGVMIYDYGVEVAKKAA